MEPRIISPELFEDHRGHLFEAYNKAAFEEQTGESIDFVQDNHSHSGSRVLRGLHYQLPPGAQGKLVRVVQGEVFDVAVDIRRSSPTFGVWYGHRLSAENRLQLWIPSGFAHGFLVLSDTADVVYKMSGYHRPELARSVRWDDPTLAIEWPLGGEPPVLSANDASAPTLAEAETFE